MATLSPIVLKSNKLVNDAKLGTELRILTLIWVQANERLHFDNSRVLISTVPDVAEHCGVL